MIVSPTNQSFSKKIFILTTVAVLVTYFLAAILYDDHQLTSEDHLKKDNHQHDTAPVALQLAELSDEMESRHLQEERSLEQQQVAFVPLKIAAIKEVSTKTCEYHGLVTIEDKEECRQAAVSMGRTISWGPHGGYKDVVDGCSARSSVSSSHMFVNKMGTCDPNESIDGWTYTGCMCTDWMPCLCKVANNSTCPSDNMETVLERFTSFNEDFVSLITDSICVYDKRKSNLCQNSKSTRKLNSGDKTIGKLLSTMAGAPLSYASFIFSAATFFV